jgi:hypothetical protein
MRVRLRFMCKVPGNVDARTVLGVVQSAGAYRPWGLE